MISASKIKEIIFDSTIDFKDKAVLIAKYQLDNIGVYARFAATLDRIVEINTVLTAFPFLPIQFFRSNKILTEDTHVVLTFTSSGTTSEDKSTHYLPDKTLYHQSIESCFSLFHGDPTQYEYFALLPSYLDHGQSSLVYMVRHLMNLSSEQSGEFYRNDYSKLMNDITNYSGGRKRMLIGVTFALWELAEQFPGTDLSDVIIVETGGMKGRRKEIVRQEFHSILKSTFNKESIQSEYGMTELLSQAWSSGEGVFRCPPWMKVLVRDPYDPLSISETGQGALNIIDMANIYSCSFIATDDIGEVFEDGSFNVKGRMDNSALRGCNLLFQ